MSSHATLYCTLRVRSIFKKLKWELWPFTQAARNFPSVSCMQSTDNKHSISQLEKRACTSLFCSRRKSKDETLVASQNQKRGHNLRAAQVFNFSPASDCTYEVQFSLAVTVLSPSCSLHLNKHYDLHLSFVWTTTDTPSLKLWTELRHRISQKKISGLIL